MGIIAEKANTGFDRFPFFSLCIYEECFSIICTYFDIEAEYRNEFCVSSVRVWKDALGF